MSERPGSDWIGVCRGCDNSGVRETHLKRAKTRHATEAREVGLPPDTYRPSAAELRETLSFNGTLEEFAKAVLQPVRVRRVKDWKRPR